MKKIEEMTYREAQEQISTRFDALDHKTIRDFLRLSKQMAMHNVRLAKLKMDNTPDPVGYLEAVHNGIYWQERQAHCEKLLELLAEGTKQK